MSVKLLFRHLFKSIPVSVGLAFFLVACASLRSVPLSELESKQLVGYWTSGDDWMSISCSGAFSCELKPENDPQGYLRGWKSTGGVIAEIKKDQFVIGPSFPVKEVFKVQQWPHQLGDKVHMTVDNRQWVRESYAPCEAD